MTITTAFSSVFGIKDRFFGMAGVEDATSPASVSAIAADGSNPFGRLVALYQSNECLLAELTSLRAKMADARSYLESPGSNRSLAEARLLHLKTKHRAALMLLRANRVEARALLGSDHPA